MLIILDRAARVLRVSLNEDELEEGYHDNGRVERVYRFRRSLKFTFEKIRKSMYLEVAFGLAQELEFLFKITYGLPVKETQLLWKLAHLPGVIVSAGAAPLVDGRKVELINKVLFRLRRTGDDLWETDRSESEGQREFRETRLKRMAAVAPGTFNEETAAVFIPGNPGSFSSEIIADDRGGLREERDPDECAECDGCERIFSEEDLTEVRRGLFLCFYCRTNPRIVGKFGLSADELIGVDNGICDWCGEVAEKDELTELAPAGNLCLTCLLTRGLFLLERRKALETAAVYSRRRL
jgi:hypothetical protein